MSSNIENIKYNDFKTTCRTCLFNCDLKIIQQDNIIIEILRYLGIRFETNDELPQQICRKCFEKIHEIHVFALQCKQTYSILVNSLNKFKKSRIHLEPEKMPQTNDTMQIEEIKIEEHKIEFVPVDETANMEIKQEIEEDATNEQNEDDWLIPNIQIDSNSDEAERDELMGTPPEITEAATLPTENLLPTKSKSQYERQYKLFMDWRLETKTDSFSEMVLLAYFQNLSSKMKPSSLWAIYSMLRMTINLKNSIDISKYPKLCAFLKRTSTGYKPRKSSTLTPEQIQQFLSSAPDETHLFTKVGLIFGMMGACRRRELMKIELQHVEDLKTALLVHIPDARNKSERQFVIGGNLYNICKKYMALRPANLENRRFFLNYQRGKCTKQPVGINKFGSIASHVAAFLKLPDASSYTGHCFRRPSATILVDSGTDTTALKRVI